MLGSMGWLPPATPLNFFVWCFLGLFFNFFIRRRYTGWWAHYSFLTSAALDAGLIISTIVIFLAISLSGANVPQWWGNVTVMETKVRMKLKLITKWLDC